MAPFNSAVMVLINGLMIIEPNDAQCMLRALVTFVHTAALFIGPVEPHLQVRTNFAKLKN